MTEKIEYSYLKGIWKTVKPMLIFGIPLVIALANQFDPAITTLTVGGILTFALNWVKHN